jgi:hypothetical protein
MTTNAPLTTAQQNALDALWQAAELLCADLAAPVPGMVYILGDGNMLLSTYLCLLQTAVGQMRQAWETLPITEER